MEVKCYLKAKRKKNMKKPFINKNLPALFRVLLLTRQFDKAGVIPFFYPYPLKEDFLKSHTPRNITFSAILLLNPLDLFF